MKHVVIVAPHFPPSNLAAVHRSRLFARHLPEFGWRPTVVTVHHRFYEEALDWDLARLVPPDLNVERVAALPTKPLRLVGDIGVRGFLPLLHRILRIADRQPVDFLYVTVPSFFAAPLGRVVHALRGIPYGIDYIDPWVHVWPGSERPFTRHWLSRKLGELLEPIAVREASLITGVAEGYYAGVLARNPRVAERAVIAAMPYGGEAADHESVAASSSRPTLFHHRRDLFQLVYAGALLPHAFQPLEQICAAIASDPDAFADVRLHFIGSGKSPSDAHGFNVRPVAEQYGVWERVITEHPARIPYLDVLRHLDAADAVFILGSTEPHYTPSKVYQAVLAKKPVFAVLHEQSTACRVISSSGAGSVLSFPGEAGLDRIRSTFVCAFADFRQFARSFDPAAVSRGTFEAYSASSVTRQLAAALDLALA